ncbi:MAG: FtsK/SpoIIIE domain-containing protein [Thermoguttaceae bacterium]|jgi:ABC-type multidrug transport system fused ATPase/permease subunit|nr:FtsK/SpoIIIE domain-containing protein [Thermoguttaceae bacterium]
MNPPSGFDHLDGQLAGLCRLVQERAPAEGAIVLRFEEAKESARKARAEAIQAITERYESDKETTETEYAAIRRQVIGRFDADSRRAETEYQAERFEALAGAKAEEDSVREACREKHFEAYTVAEAVKNRATIEAREANAQIAAQSRQAAAVRRQTEIVLRQYRQWREQPETGPDSRQDGAPAEQPPAGQQSQDAAAGATGRPAEAVPPDKAPNQRLAGLLREAQDQLHRLTDMTVPQLFQGARPLGLLLIVCLVVIVPVALIAGLGGWHWIVVAGGTVVVVYGVAMAWLYRVARGQCTLAYSSLRETLAGLAGTLPAARAAVQAKYEHTVAAAAAKQDSQTQTADRELRQALAEYQTRKDQAINEMDSRHAARMSQLAAQRDGQLETAESRYSQRMTEIHKAYRDDSDRVERQYAAAMLDADQQYQREWAELTDRWFSGVHQFETALDDCERWCDAKFPDWTSADWQRWIAPQAMPPVVRFGRHAVSLAQIDNGLPQDERLRLQRTEFQLSAVLPFPERSLLMLEAGKGDRTAPFALMQTILLRMLTALPPGKLRLTIIDPVGLGENFAAFMHLADYDEKLVASRIWTDRAHVEQRLADLTAHMENVLQVYLRNTFATIEEYNAFAGEMAEPYQLLVVADFPASFSEAAAARLKSIVASGARCGVFTLLSTDRSLPLPRGFQWPDLLPHATRLSYRDGRFLREHPDYGDLSLEFPPPPPSEQFTQMVRQVGERVDDAARVEVPFETVAPEPGQRWTADSRAGIDIPLGRAGATRLQHLRLGRGTSQHVLISGKSGSGKSTLLHALITNIALRYSPEEIELYLIDFKKGVEFKAYADGSLPHARVVAIESEREFGLSVLARLDDELRRRGDRLRELRVQDIRGYRNARPDERMPRILLIVDEFQELFIEDDRLAQDAALFLDRLVRQGRAFGIHVLLGSQTLSGAYSLARSTIGQMAVRIALQCSEADSHLILSEENTAARLLTRPGEAIYNDANGLFEGNHPFQVAWLPDHQRDSLLGELGRLAEARRQSFELPIVFEGNVPADPAANSLLTALLDADHWPAPSPASHAWLGAPVAIKGPTAATFVRQGGSNLLVVGQDEPAALGVLASAVVSLGAQHPPGARFYVFDGMRPDAPHAGFWECLARALPHEVSVIAPHKVEGPISEVFAECARREAANDEDAPPIYFVVYHLARFRDFLKADDDFGFSRLDADKPPSPAQQLSELLRRGPAVGIHGLLWCDSYNALSRAIDRQALRDVEMRVLFRMNASDSSNLIDSPAASRLSEHRAVLYDEGQGRIEKFRPYGPPSAQWLDSVHQHFHARHGATILPLPVKKSAQ